MFRKQNLCPGSKNVFDLMQKHFLVSEQQNLFPQHMFPARLNWKTFSSATMLSSLALKVKDGAYYCYCAYVLRISRHSGFLWVVPTNTGIFLRGLKPQRKQNLASALGIPKENWGNMHALLRDNQASI